MQGLKLLEILKEISKYYHPKNDKIIAVHIIGAHAGELIGEAATALKQD